MGTYFVCSSLPHNTKTPINTLKKISDVIYNVPSQWFPLFLLPSPKEKEKGGGKEGEAVSNSSLRPNFILYNFTTVSYSFHLCCCRRCIYFLSDSAYFTLFQFMLNLSMLICIYCAHCFLQHSNISSYSCSTIWLAIPQIMSICFFSNSLLPQKVLLQMLVYRGTFCLSVPFLKYMHSNGISRSKYGDISVTWLA